MADKAERIFDWTLKEQNNDSFKVLKSSFIKHTETKSRSLEFDHTMSTSICSTSDGGRG